MEERKQMPKGMPHCEKCNLTYDKEKRIPLYLPCGDTYCKSCLMKEMQEQQKITCLEEDCD